MAMPSISVQHTPCCSSRCHNRTQLQHKHLHSQTSSGHHRLRCMAGRADAPQYSSRQGGEMGELISSTTRYMEVPAAGDERYAWTRVDKDSLKDRELNIDGGAIFGSLTLLAVIFYFSFDRILGLDVLFAKWVRERKEAKQNKARDEVMDARLKMQQKWDQDSSDSGDLDGKTSKK